MNERKSNTNVQLKQVLTSCELYILLCERPQWISQADVEDIKMIFRLANFIEKAILNFKTKNILTKFVNLFKKHFSEKCYDVSNKNLESIFTADYVLGKFFKDQNVTQNTLDIVVRVYSSLYPRERFKNAIKNLVLVSSLLKALADFSNIVTDDVNILKCRLMLNNWSNQLEIGKEVDVISSVDSYLSLYSINVHINLLFGILLLNNVSEMEKKVQSIIVSRLFQKMLDRSILSKHFWIALFKNTNVDTVCEVCCKYENILSSFFDFIEFSGSFMTQEDTIIDGLKEWKPNENISLCPEITYNDLFKFIKSMCCTNKKMKNYVFNRLNEILERPESNIWVHVKSDLVEVDL